MTIEIHPLLLLLFVLINSVAFVVMLWDKMRSRQAGASRVSEGMLFFLATLFGGIGIYAGMMLIRHKSRKWYFLIGIPLLIIENLATLTLLTLWLSGSLS